MKEEQLLKIKRTRDCLNSAVSHINKAKELMSKSVTINGECFKSSGFSGASSSINNHVYRINNSIIPNKCC